MTEPDPSTKADNWNVHWEHFADAASENPAQIYRHRLVLNLLKETSEGAMRLLDLGSGQGDFLAKAVSELPAAELAGFELSEVGAGDNPAQSTSGQGCGGKSVHATSRARGL